MRSAFASVGGLTRLSASAAEARSVSRFGQNSVLRLRGEASESWIKQAALADFPVLHFATHALVDQRTSARTALALAPGIGQDGFLTPAELANMHLPADVVVLSACRTAGGVVIQGEGVQGLTGPFLEAGARAVVATHWSIPDRGIRSLMESFYHGLSDGLPASEALQRAKLSARTRGVPASQWAAFTLVGDPSVRVPLSKPGLEARRWVAFALVLALAAVGVIVRARRRGAATRGASGRL
jgi:CHAT domain-containing protein